MALAGLRQGAQHLKPSSGGGGRYTSYLSWSDGEAKTILFTTPFEEVAKIKIHNFVKIPDDSKEKGFRNGTFMCRKDPAWLSESNGECYLCDVVGHKAVEKHVAIAVELEAVTKPGTTAIEELRVLTRSFTREDGTVVEYPQWGIIMQGFKNFFNYFSAFASKYGNINETAFDVTRIGGDEMTTYPIMAVPSPIPDLTPFQENIPTLVDVLEKMGSKEKYDTELVGADKFDQSSPYGNKSETKAADSKVHSKFEELQASLPGGLGDKLESYSAV